MSIKKSLNRSFWTGLVVIIIIGAFLWLWQSISMIMASIEPAYLILVLIPGPFWLKNLAGMLIFIFLIGALVNLLGGKTGLVGKMIKRIPVLKQIAEFSASLKRTINFFLEEKPNQEERVCVLIKWGEGIFSLGFTTYTEIEEANKKSGERLIVVFCPSTPFAWSAPLFLLVKRERIIPLEMKPHQAIKLIMTGGLLKSQ